MMKLSKAQLREHGIEAESGLERAFETYLRVFDLPAAVQQYRFDEGRRWSFDFAWPELRVAVEIDGEDVHRGWAKVNADRGKGNAATLAGWIVLRFTGTMLREDPGSCMELVLEAMRDAEEG